MKYFLKFTLICFSLLFCYSSNAQLMHHGDDDFAQLNLYSKYLNESNNIIVLLNSSLSNDSVKKKLRENFKKTLYHMPELTLIERFGGLLAYGTIKSNVTRLEKEVHINMYNDLQELRALEIELNEFFLSETEQLKSFEDISSEILSTKFEAIIDKQQILIERLNKINNEYKKPKFYNDINSIYTAFIEILYSTENDKTDSIDNVHKLIDDFDFSPIEKFEYPKGLLINAFDEIKLAMENGLKPNDIYKQQGIPQLLNSVLLIYKNNNNEAKFIELMNPPVELK